jgi:hypothetical protein
MIAAMSIGPKPVLDVDLDFALDLDPDWIELGIFL